MEMQEFTQKIRNETGDTFASTSDEMQRCIQLCQECHRTCEQIIPYCLEKGGMHSDRKHIELLLCCADICRTSAHFMMWDSPLHAETCRVCAQVCSACADDCERMDDGVMKACAKICRECSESCRTMSTQH